MAAADRIVLGRPGAASGAASPCATSSRTSCSPFSTDPGAAPPRTGSPTVVLVVGVNGTGKTTTVAKLAHLYKSQGAEPLVCAADTFRAAAVEQLDDLGGPGGC